MKMKFIKVCSIERTKARTVTNKGSLVLWRDVPHWRQGGVLSINQPFWERMSLISSSPCASVVSTQYWPHSTVDTSDSQQGEEPLLHFCRQQYSIYCCYL